MPKIIIIFILIIAIFVVNLSAMAQNKQVDPIIEKSVQMVNSKQYNSAIILLSNAINNKDNTNYIYIRGQVYIDSKQYNLALKDFNVVISRLPNEYKSYYYRGIVKGNMKRYNEALIDFKKVLQLRAPEDSFHFLSNTHYLIGLCYFNKKDYEFAIKNFIECLHLNPQYSWAYFYKALAWDRKDEVSEAIKAYRVFLRVATNTDAAKIQYANKRIAALSEEADSDKTPQVIPRKPKKKPPKPAAPKTEVGELFSAPLGEEAF